MRHAMTAAALSVFLVGALLDDAVPADVLSDGLRTDAR
jgi:hypothetical protein